jgi:hypothetical protein
MKAFMSPVGVGWYDRLEAGGRGWNPWTGADLAAQEEARRIIEYAEPWPMAEIPLGELDHNSQAALAEGIARLLVSL